MNKKRNDVSIFLYALSALCFIVTIVFLLYPTVSNWWNERHSSRAVASYDENVSNLNEEEIERMFNEARQYNQKLQFNGTRFTPTNEEHEKYESILDVSGTGIIGYVEIDKINVKLPIYHGTSDVVLQKAIGHFEGSSFPIGENGTHAVLSGHSGLSSAKMFTDLPKLNIGDEFKVTVLGKEMHYKIDRIETVLPDNLNYFELDSDNDYVTLVTCTPYGVNSHRLLVRGSRLESEKEYSSVISTEKTVESIFAKESNEQIVSVEEMIQSFNTSFES